MKSLIAVLCLVALPVHAEPCRGTYSLGETVPDACKGDRRGGLPVYRRWGKDHQPTPTAPVREPTRPSFHSIYNSSIYGFGR